MQKPNTTTAGHRLARNRSGYFEVRYSEKQIDGSWRSRSFSTRTKDRGAARSVESSFVAGTALLAARAADGGLVPLLEIFELYERAKPTQRAHLMPARRLLGGLTLSTLSPLAVEEYTRARVGEGITLSTIRRELTCVTAAANWCAKTQSLGIRASDVPFITKPPEAQHRERYLDEAQEKEFWEAAMDLSREAGRVLPITLFVALGLDTAARREALLDLTWDRVDFARGQVDFRKPGRAVVNKRRAVVSISRRLRPVLEKAHQEHLEHLARCAGTAGGTAPFALASAWSASALVVGLSVMELRTRWGLLLQRVPWCASWMIPHLMRHTWATLAAHHGVGLLDIASVLGDTAATVHKKYIHHVPGNSSAVNARFGGGQGRGAL